MSVPEIVNITVQTPYPGTETWFTESRRLTTQDYRLFDVQHAVLPTRLPLHQFYTELVKTQQVLARKHLGVAALAKTSGIVARQLLRGQTNFARMIWKFNQVYHPDRQYADHLREPVTCCRSRPNRPRHLLTAGSCTSTSRRDARTRPDRCVAVTAGKRIG